MAVKEFNNLKPTAIHIKMNVTFFKIWRHGFPDFHLRKHLFNLTPSAVANSLTVAFWRNKKQIQISSISLDADYNTTDNLSIIKDTVGFSTIPILVKNYYPSTFETSFKNFLAFICSFVT